MSRGLFGGGGGGDTGRTIAILSSNDTVNNSTTLANSSLTATLAANKTYALLLAVHFDGSTTADAKFGFTGPSGFGGRCGGLKANVSLAFGTGAFDLDGGVETTGCTTVSLFTHFFGYVTTAGTAGTLTFQFAQNTQVAEDLDLVQGSYMILWEI